MRLEVRDTREGRMTNRVDCISARYGPCEARALTAAVRPCAVVFADAGGNRAHQFPLGLADEGTPDVEDQHGARNVAVVPGPVLDRVVENEGLPWMPLAHFGANAEATAGWDYQRQMHGQARVGDARMSRDPGLGIENGKDRRRATTRHIAPRPRLERSDRSRAAR